MPDRPTSPIRPPALAPDADADADADPSATHLDADGGAPPTVDAEPAPRPTTVVIVDDDVAEPEAVGVAGDPLLAGPSAPADDTEPPSGPRTISIVDDGVPDSVYIGGNLEATDASRSTVLIEDREGAATTISVEDASSATRIEPRMRERRIAIKRAAGRKRLKWAIVVVVLLGLVVAALAVLGSGLFAIEQVDVEGAEHTDAAALAAVIDDLEGTPVLRADTDAAERELETLPWVEDARVTHPVPGRGDDRAARAHRRGDVPGRGRAVAADRRPRAGAGAVGGAARSATCRSSSATSRRSSPASTDRPAWPRRRRWPAR